MILVGTDEGIYRWYEDGPWLTFHSLQNRAVVGLASPGAGVIVAVESTGGVWETTNNGLDWREIPRPTKDGRPSALAVGGDPQSVFLASKPLKLYRRPIGAPVPREPATPVGTFLGRAWDLALGSGARGSATATAEAPDSTDAADRLNGWLTLGVPEASQTPVATHIRSLLPGTSSGFAALAGAGLWRSDDAGQSWAACAGVPTEVFSIRLIPSTDGGIVVGTSDGVWVSEDNGQSWSEKSAGLGGARHVRAVEVRPDDPKHLLAGAAPRSRADGDVVPVHGFGFALYESKDAGKTWARVKRGFPVQLEYDIIDDIRWDPAAPGYAIIALASGECWRTRSGGDWWEPIARQTRAARVLCAVR
jgi:hypothetical protein